MPPPVPVNPLAALDDRAALTSAIGHAAEQNAHVDMDDEREPCQLASGQGSSGGAGQVRKKDPLCFRMSSVERLIYRNYRYLTEKLEVKMELVELLESRKLFSDSQMLELRDVMQRHRNRPPPCRPVNKLLVGMVLRFASNREVDHFLWCLEQHQKEIPLTILKGQTLKELTSGSLSGGSVLGQMASPTASLDGSAASGTLSLSGSATSASLASASLSSTGAAAACEDPEASTSSTPVGVDYDEYPEPDVDFEDSEFFVSLSPVPDPMQDNDDWPPKFDIGPGGGTFHTCQDLVFVSVPRGALEEERKVSVMSADIEETHQTQYGPVYIGKALCCEENGLKFQRFVTIAVEDSNMTSVVGDKVFIFGSDTSVDELPDFNDVTAHCRPSLDVEKKKVTFLVDHFSFYVYVIAAASIPVAVVGILLRNREARVEILAEALPDPHTGRCQLLINIEPPGSKTEIVQNYHRVSFLHNMLLLAPFDKRICLTLAFANVGEDTSEQRWELESSAADRLLEGLNCPDHIYPLLVRMPGAGRDGAVFPIVAAFECKTEWTEKTVLVKFEIDPTKLIYRYVPSIPPAPLLPAQKCRANHPPDGKGIPMSEERQKALTKLFAELVQVPPKWAIDSMVAELVACGVVPTGYLEEKLRSLPTSHERMRALLLHITRGTHTMFDCFHHALKHAVGTWSDLPQRLLEEEQKALQEWH